MAYYLQSTGAVVLTFGLVVFLHEAGHFFLCRILGVRVERFAFGFGPELIGVTKNNTRYSVCALPLGGFVKPAGEDPKAGTGAPDEYFGQNWRRRLLIVAAGPAMNYVLAFALFSGVVYLKGLPVPSKAATIGDIVSGYPADKAGLQSGDAIESVNGRPIASWDELASAIHKYPGHKIALSYGRGGKTIDISIVPRKDDATGYGVIGIFPDISYKMMGFFPSLGEGARQCWEYTRLTVMTIASKLWHRKRPDLMGPVGIVQSIGRAAHSGWDDFVFFIGIISVAIGFFNVLPIPLLDGGHMAAYVWEGVSGKRPSEEAVNTANGVGIALLLSLLVLATYNDIMRIKNEDRAAAPNAAGAIHGQSPQK